MNGLAQFLPSGGFENVTRRTKAFSFSPIPLSTVHGEEDELDPREGGTNLPDRFDPVHFGHGNIGQITSGCNLKEPSIRVASFRLKPCRRLRSPPAAACQWPRDRQFIVRK